MESLLRKLEMTKTRQEAALADTVKQIDGLRKLIAPRANEPELPLDGRSPPAGRGRG